MAPIKGHTRPHNIENPAISKVLGLRSTMTRSTTLPLRDLRPKRKANSPLKATKNTKQFDMGTKRAAFGDITNATTQQAINDKGKLGGNGMKLLAKKVVVQSKYLQTTKSVQDARLASFKTKENVATGNQIGLRNRVGQLKRSVNVKSVEEKIESVKPRYVEPPGSESSAKSEDSLYVSALEETSSPIIENTSAISSVSGSQTVTKLEQLAISDRNVNKVAEDIALKLEISPGYKVPEGVNDFDKENWNDLYATSQYAMDIFNYLKSRETYFQIPDYIKKQKQINAHMRALLVDWMVEVQESFELNHETLYLAVKLLDKYLNVVAVTKDFLQLVGTSALFIASKYDERVPPVSDDFLYICDGAFNKKQMFQMEINILKAAKFELGIPLSYRFLRRYARVEKISLPTLTLARFYLEYSLLDYSTVTRSDSKMAAAALYIALKVEKISEWTESLEYYSGYKLEDFMPEVKILNAFLHNPQPKDSLATIRKKYSHKVFFEVAKKPLIDL